MLKQNAEVLADVKDRVLSLLLMLLFLLLGVVWGVAMSAELKSRSTSLSVTRCSVRETAAIPSTGGQKKMTIEAEAILIRSGHLRANDALLNRRQQRNNSGRIDH